MTRKQKIELEEARKKEFNIYQSDSDEMRQAFRELNHMIDAMVEEGWDRQEAIIFAANICRPK